MSQNGCDSRWPSGVPPLVVRAVDLTVMGEYAHEVAGTSDHQRSSSSSHSMCWVPEISKLDKTDCSDPDERALDANWRGDRAAHGAKPDYDPMTSSITRLALHGAGRLD